MNIRGVPLADPVSPHLPSAGPIMLVIPGLSDVLIAANSLSPEILYTWPGPFLVSGFWLSEETIADAATIANLRLRLHDGDGELMTDGGGGAVSLVNAPALAFCGRSLRWQPFRRVIRSGQKWLMQIENLNAVDVIPQLYFKLEAQ